MKKHHFMARLQRLERVVAEGQTRMDALTANPAQDRTTKRLRTVATRTLDENRASLMSLIETHGAKFGHKDGEGGP
jgi:hypothetical protein